MDLKVKLFYRSKEEDRVAMRLLAKAGIPYLRMGPTTTEPMPRLEYGYWRYDGLKAIERFIEAWLSGRLPPILHPKN